MNNREYNILLKSKRQYCRTCCKRSGSFYAYCGPGRRYGKHGNGKMISSKKFREYKSWKHNRLKQYK